MTTATSRRVDPTVGIVQCECSVTRCNMSMGMRSNPWNHPLAAHLGPGENLRSPRPATGESVCCHFLNDLKYNDADFFTIGTN